MKFLLIMLAVGAAFWGLAALCALGHSQDMKGMSLAFMWLGGVMLFWTSIVNDAESGIIFFAVPSVFFAGIFLVRYAVQVSA